MEDTLARLAVLKYVVMHSRAFRLAGALVASGGLVGLIWKVALNRHRRNRLRHLRERKQEERRREIEELRQHVWCKMTLDQANDITSKSVSDLLSSLKNRKLKPTHVLLAYQMKALLAHDKTNCLVEPILKAEDYLCGHLDDSGPLYGLPVSVKECFALQGHDSTIGCSQWIDDPFQEDAVVIKVLGKQGAMPFVRTNIPQTLISYDSSNPIFGRVLNPHDLTRTSGGSSSGEAALIASGGSICGLGSDIGGSIRIPAAFCGICGLKPTANRISKIGRRSISDSSGQNNVLASWGPMGRDVDSLVVLMRGLLHPEMFQLDPSIPVIPFQDEIFKDTRKFRIGYLFHGGVLDPVPCVVRAVEEAITALESAGHKLVAWDPGSTFVEAYDIITESLAANEGREVTETLKYDEVDGCVKDVYNLASLPNVLKKLLAFALKPFDESTSKLISQCCGVSSQGWFDIIKRTKTLREEVISDWQRNKLDGIICPVVPCPATTTGAVKAVANFTAAFNVLDFPAGCLPVSRVTKLDEDAMAGYPEDSRNQRLLKRDLQRIEGLPLSVQVVTLPWREEKCLKIMSDIEKHLPRPQTDCRNRSDIF